MRVLCLRTKKLNNSHQLFHLFSLNQHFSQFFNTFLNSCYYCHLGLPARKPSSQSTISLLWRVLLFLPSPNSPIIFPFAWPVHYTAPRTPIFLPLLLPRPNEPRPSLAASVFVATRRVKGLPNKPPNNPESQICLAFHFRALGYCWLYGVFLHVGVT